MGTTIEFDRIAVKYEVDEDFRPTRYLALAKVGADNCFNRDGSIAKDWSLLEAGDKTRVIQKVCRAAADAESGMMRYSNGSTKPENVIKNWRQTIEDDPFTLEEFQYKFPDAKLSVYQPENPDELGWKAENALETVRDEWKQVEKENLDRVEFHAEVTPENLVLFETMRKDRKASTRLYFKPK